jgi:MoxR-like ATPase
MEHIEKLSKIKDQLNEIIVGNQDTVEHLIVSMICGGHVLLEGVPGVGKTTLALSLAKSMDLNFKRIQFNPDTLSSDVTGFYMFNQKTNEFDFKEGSVFGNLILADEINRTTPKVQSSLLEVMEEKQVTVDGNTHTLPTPHLIIATQNPKEHFGTYPLPESQIDRFFMKLYIDYPSYYEETEIVLNYKQYKPKEVESVLSKDELLEIFNKVDEMELNFVVSEYITKIIRATRENELVYIGASPRSAIALARASKALAYINGENYVTPDHVKHVVYSVLNHRILLTQEAKMKKYDVKGILDEIISKIPVPRIFKLDENRSK